MCLRLASFVGLCLKTGWTILRLCVLHERKSAFDRSSPSAYCHLPLSSAVFRCLPLSSAICRRLPLLFASFCCLPLPSTAFRSLPLASAGFCCLPLPSAICRLLPLPFAVFCCLPMPSAAFRCLLQPLPISYIYENNTELLGSALRNVVAFFCRSNLATM